MWSEEGYCRPSLERELDRAHLCIKPAIPDRRRMKSFQQTCFCASWVSGLLPGSGTRCAGMNYISLFCVVLPQALQLFTLNFSNSHFQFPNPDKTRGIKMTYSEPLSYTRHGPNDSIHEWTINRPPLKPQALRNAQGELLAEEDQHPLVMQFVNEYYGTVLEALQARFNKQWPDLIFEGHDVFAKCWQHGIQWKELSILRWFAPADVSDALRLCGVGIAI